MKIFKKFAAYTLVVMGFSVAAAGQQDIITTIAGKGPDGIPGTSANINGPDSMAIDAAGNIYFTAVSQERVFKYSRLGSSLSSPATASLGTTATVAWQKMR